MDIVTVGVFCDVVVVVVVEAVVVAVVVVIADDVEGGRVVVADDVEAGRVVAVAAVKDDVKTGRAVAAVAAAPVGAVFRVVMTVVPVGRRLEAVVGLAVSVSPWCVDVPCVCNPAANASSSARAIPASITGKSGAEKIGSDPPAAVGGGLCGVGPPGVGPEPGARKNAKASTAAIPTAIAQIFTGFLAKKDRISAHPNPSKK